MSRVEHESFFVGAYIPGRHDSFETCLRRTMAMFGLLRTVDATFSQWYARGWTREEALQHRLDLEPTELARAFEKMTSMEESWYHLSAWNALDDDSASAFRISCGKSPSTSDTVIFTPHEAGKTGERLIQAPVMTALLRALAVAWEPRVGIVMSHRHREAAFKDAAFEHRIGWINYFSRSLGALPPLPAPVRTEPVDDLGTLVILTPERFSTSNPDHVARSLQVADLLEGAGVLRPLVPAAPVNAT